MVKDSIELIDTYLKSEGISRRDAIKMFGASGVAMFAASSTTIQAKTTSSTKAKILIVGGGLAGMSTAARLSNSLDDPDITMIEPSEYSTSYQSGQTLVGAGIWTNEDILYRRDDFVPDGVTLIKEKAVEFDPENNSIKTSSGRTVEYDYMVVAAGLKLDYSKIEGLGITDTITSKGDDSDVRKIIGKDGIASIYFANGATDTWIEMQKFIDRAKSKRRVKGLFTHPNTPIKCCGAPKKIMYLTDARLREAGVRDHAELTFLPDSSRMFDIKEYHDAIVNQFKARDMKWDYRHNLVAVDPVRRVATFDKHWSEKGSWDKDLKKYSIITKSKKVKREFDLLHITPPMRAAEEIANSPIGSSEGWVPVDRETLQHIKYHNIFALGDIIDTPMGKTGSSIRKQYKVVVDNIISMMEDRELRSKYRGYTVCPLITGIGTVMLAEFNWTKKPTPSFSLDPTQERWIWWLLEVYALKPMTQYGMLSGGI